MPFVSCFNFRAGRLPLKKEPKEPVTSFENPRYSGDNVDIQPTGKTVFFNPAQGKWFLFSKTKLFNMSDNYDA